MSQSQAGPDLAPIFITGTHRSGTTWLQQLVVETGCFDYVSAYHIIKYDALRDQPRDPASAPAHQEVAAAFARLGLSGRAIDEVEVSPDVPEEYGFILNNAGTGWTVTPRNLKLLRQICGRVRRDESRPVVLKNPWDSTNFLYLKKAIPRARFLFIHRHPERVIHSGLRAARTVLDKGDPYLLMLSRDYRLLLSRRPGQRLRLALNRLLLSRRMELGVRFITSKVAQSDDYFVKNIGRLDSADYISLRYEDLCENPMEVFGRVLEFLRVGPAQAEPLKTGARPRGGDVLPEVQWYRDKIAEKTAAYMNMHGYLPGGAINPLPARSCRT